MVNFLDALNTQAVSEIEKPKAMPKGTYSFTIAKVPENSTTNDGEWSSVNFSAKVLAPQEDVDADELEAFGDPAGRLMRVSFMAPTDPDKKADIDQALYNLRRFLTEVLQVEASDEETLSLLMAKSPNHQFLGKVTHRQRKDTGEIVAELRPSDCAAIG